LERIARTGYEAWNRDDLGPARAYADPEIEVHVAQGSDLPVGLDDVYYGPDGYCRITEEWVEAWRSWRVEVEDVVEVAPDKVLVTGRHIGEGVASGAKLEEWSAALYTIRRGKILRVDVFFFSDRDSVSEAVSSIAEGGASTVEQARAHLADPSA
jgi:ketosteroid isomerase-like protein